MITITEVEWGLFKELARLWPEECTDKSTWLADGTAPVTHLQVYLEAARVHLPGLEFSCMWSLPGGILRCELDVPADDAGREWRIYVGEGGRGWDTRGVVLDWLRGGAA